MRNSHCVLSIFILPLFVGCEPVPKSPAEAHYRAAIKLLEDPTATEVAYGKDAEAKALASEF